MTPAALARTFPAPIPASWSRYLVASLALAGLLLAVGGTAYRGLYVDRHPLVNDDEGYYGQLVASRIDRRVTNPDAATRYDAFRFSGPAAWPYEVAFLLDLRSLAAARAVSIGWGIGMVLATFGLARELYGWLAGGFAALAASATAIFVLASAMVRPDVAVATIGAAGAWLAWRSLSRGGPRWMLVAAGALAASGWQGHPSGLGLAALPPLAILLVGPRRRWAADFGWLSLGAVLGLVPYLARHVLADPVRYLESLTYWRQVYGTPLLDRGPLAALDGEVFRLSRAVEDQPLGVLLFGAAALALALPLAPRRAADLYVLGGLAANFAWLAAATGPRLSWYLVLYVPLFATLIGRFFGWSSTGARLDWARPLAPLVPALGLVAVVVAFNPIESLREASRQERSNYGLLAADLRSVVPPGASVAAFATYWYALSDHPYRDLQFVLQNKHVRLHGVRFDQYLGLQPPVDVVILSSQMGVDPELRRGLRQTVNRHGGREVGSFSYRGYGQVQVYLLDQTPATAAPPESTVR